MGHGYGYCNSLARRAYTNGMSVNSVYLCPIARIYDSELCGTVKSAMLFHGEPCCSIASCKISHAPCYSIASCKISHAVS